MRLQIMRNLEITIHNLHISYETISTTKLGHPFSFGLTIYHLEMMVRYFENRIEYTIEYLDYNKSSTNWKN
jgi:hypothetical protein